MLSISTQTTSKNIDIQKKISYYAHYSDDKTKPMPKVSILRNSNFVSEPSLTRDFSTFLVFFGFSVNFMPPNLTKR